MMEKIFTLYSLLWWMQQVGAATGADTRCRKWVPQVNAGCRVPQTGTTQLRHSITHCLIVIKTSKTKPDASFSVFCDVSPGFQ